MDTPKKYCIRCNKWRDRKYFWRRGGSLDGLRIECCYCSRQADKRYRSNFSPETVERRKQDRRRYKLRHPRRIREQRCRGRLSFKDRLNRKMSKKIAKFLIGGKNGISWTKLVGYNAERLRGHLEKQFLPDMTWDNYGEWHIDHRIPISAFNFSSPEHSDFKKCWALKNLQPMWAIENLKKGAVIDKPFQPSLQIG